MSIVMMIGGWITAMEMIGFHALNESGKPDSQRHRGKRGKRGPVVSIRTERRK